MIFFTADQHFCHKNVMRYCNRPFETVEQMNDTLIRNHNERVSKNDDVYMLGDFIFSNNLIEAQMIFDALNGRKYFIKGNHDKITHRIHGWQWVKPLYDLKVDGNSITLCHYAMRVWNKSHHGSWHLYGHNHGNLPGIGKSFDVGVDCHNFYPISYDEVKTIMAGLTPG